MADIFEVTKQVLASPEYQQKSFEGKVQIKQALMENLSRTDQFLQMDLENRQQVRKAFLTDIAGFNPEDFAGAEPEVQEILTDIQNVRGGGQSSLNAWDGFVEGTRGFLSGKIGAGIVDIFTAGDTTEALFGDKRQEVEKYRDYVYNTYDPEGLKDYKAGKAFGVVGGFAADALAMTTLYGGIGQAGLLTKGFSGVANKLLQASAAKYGTKALAYIPLAIGQGLFEGTMYIGEEALAQKITGTLDSDAEIQSFIENIPSTFMKGIGYFALGETLGAGFSRLTGGLKSLAPVFTGKGARNETFHAIRSKADADLVDGIRAVLGGDESARAKFEALKSYGVDDKTVNDLYEGMLRVKSLQDPNLYLDNPAELNKLAWKTMYGMDVEYLDGAMRVSSFNNEAIEPKVFENDLDLSKFIQKNYEKVQNIQFEEVAKIASDRLGTVRLEAMSVGGKKSQDFDNQEILSAFRPESKMVDPDQMRELASKYITKDFKIQPVDDYFRTGTKTMAADGTILVPTRVSNGREADKFARDFLEQLSKNTDARFEFDTKNLSSLLRDTGSVKYSNSFIKRLAGADNVKFHEGGITDILEQGKVVYRATSLEDAASYVHAKQFTDPEIAAHVKKQTGYVMQKDGNAIVIKDGDKTVNTFASMQDLFKNEAYRPAIPFESRPSFLSIDMSAPPSEVSTFATGKAGQIAEALSQYSKTGKGVVEGKVRGGQKFTYDPKWNKYKVTLGDTGFSKEFNDLTSAEAWLKKDLGVYQNLQEEALEKGFMIQPVRNGYQVYTPNMEPKFAPNLKEAEKVVASLDDVRNVKDIFDGTDDEWDLILDSRIKAGEYAKDQIDKLGLMREVRATKYPGGFRKSIEKVFVPIRERMEKTGNKQAIDLFDRMVGADRAFREEYSRLKVQTNALFHGKNKYTAYDLQTMGAVLGGEFPQNDWESALKKLDSNLDPQKLSKMVSTMDSYRKILDSAGQRFNIDPATWEENYFSHVVKQDPSNLHKMLNFDVMKAAEGQGKIEMGDEFFRHLRSEDWISGVSENNIETVMDVYLRAGLRKQYLDSVIKDTQSFIRGNDVTLEEVVLLKESADKLAGQVYSSDRAKEMLERLERVSYKAKQIIDGQGKYEKLTPQQRAKKAMDVRNSNYQAFANDLVTSSLMAFKMKMPVRNVSQVFTVLAPLADAGYVADAMKSLDSRAAQEALYKELHTKELLSLVIFDPNMEHGMRRG